MYLQPKIISPRDENRAAARAREHADAEHRRHEYDEPKHHRQHRLVLAEAAQLKDRRRVEDHGVDASQCDCFISSAVSL